MEVGVFSAVVCVSVRLCVCVCTCVNDCVYSRTSATPSGESWDISMCVAYVLGVCCVYLCPSILLYSCGGYLSSLPSLPLPHFQREAS